MIRSVILATAAAMFLPLGSSHSVSQRGRGGAPANFVRANQAELSKKVEMWGPVQNELKIGDSRSLTEAAKISTPCKMKPVTPDQMKNLKWLLAMICAHLQQLPYDSLRYVAEDTTLDKFPMMIQKQAYDYLGKMLNKIKSEINGALSANRDDVLLKLLDVKNINRLLISVINMFRAQNCKGDTDITSKDSLFQIANGINAYKNNLQGTTVQQIRAIESAMKALNKLKHLEDFKKK